MNESIQVLANQFLVTSTKMRRLISLCCDISLEEKIATLLQLQALTYLDDHQNATVGELSHELVMSSSAIAQLTDRLVIAGRIVRLSDPHDRRITRLQLTSAGKDELIKLKKHYIDKVSEILSYISEKDRNELVRIQTELMQKLESSNK